MVKRNIWLDIFKLFLCFLVICIHYVRQLYEHFPIYRVAVVCFFMISGYFVYTKDDEKTETKAFNFLRRSFVYLLMGIVLYFVFDFVICIVKEKPLDEFFKSQMYSNFFKYFFIYNYSLSNTGNHLWFLIALFVVSMIHYVLVKFKLLKLYPFIVLFTLLIHFIFNGYIPYFPKFDVSLYYLRNALFMGLPLFGIGYLMAKVNFHPKWWLKYVYLVLGVSFFFLQILDADGRILEMYPSSILASIFLLQFLLGLKPVNSDWYYKWFGKNMYFYIYLLHVMVGYLLTDIFSLKNSYSKAFIVLLVSFAIYESIYLLTLLFKKILTRYKIKNGSSQLLCQQ